MNRKIRSRVAVAALMRFLAALVVLSVGVMRGEARTLRDQHAGAALKGTSEPGREQNQVEERWAVVMFQGAKAGYAVERMERTATERKMTMEIHFSMRRDKLEISMVMETGIVETLEGEPVSMTTRMVMGKDPDGPGMKTTYVFKPAGEGKEAHVEMMQGNGPAKIQPWPAGEWLSPIAAMDFSQKELEAGKEAMEFQTIDPTMGLRVLTVSRRVAERGKVEVIGRVVPAVKWISKIKELNGIEQEEWVDEKGSSIRSKVDLGMMSIEVIESDKEFALAKAEAPELMASTLIKMPEAIRNARMLENGQYELRVLKGELPDLVNDAGQTFRRVDASSGMILVRSKPEDAAPALQVDVGNKAYSQSNGMVDYEDASVEKLVRQAAEKFVPGDGVMEKAEKLRRFVYDFIEEKSLGVGFASASEIAQTGEGDCTEHGVLLCALLRANGIPARVVSGLLYVDKFAGEENIFGYHMWTQGLIEIEGKKRWVDLDAVLGDEVAFDATHIAISTSSLAEGDVVNAMVTLAPLLGRLEIEVEEVK